MHKVHKEQSFHFFLTALWCLFLLAEICSFVPRVLEFSWCWTDPAPRNSPEILYKFLGDFEHILRCFFFLLSALCIKWQPFYFREILMKKMYPHLPNYQIRKCRKGYFEASCTDLVKENDHLLNSETENKFFVETKTRAEQGIADV